MRKHVVYFIEADIMFAKILANEVDSFFYDMGSEKSRILFNSEVRFSSPFQGIGFFPAFETFVLENGSCIHADLQFICVRDGFEPIDSQRQISSASVFE